MVKSKTKKLIISSLCMVVFFALSYILLYKGFTNFNCDKVTYNEKNSLDYKVYLKENDFFETPYLIRDDKAAYITSLIDYIDVDIDYNVALGEKRSGNYKYSVKAEISAATQDGNGTYWKKEYELVPLVVKDFDNSGVISVKDNVKIDYHHYNELLTEFKKAYNISMQGILKIYVNVETNIKSNINSEFIKNSSTSTISLPLTKATIEVPIEVNAPANNGILSSGLVYLRDAKYTIFKVLGGLSLILGVASLVYFCIVFLKKGQKIFDYKKSLKQILKTYDGILVTVSSLPTLDDLNVINVSSFSELLDAHGEVRLPINFYEDKNGATFVLVNDKMAWRYVLSKKQG